MSWVRQLLVQSVVGGEGVVLEDTLYRMKIVFMRRVEQARGMEGEG